jgi:hypothetical protein
MLQITNKPFKHNASTPNVSTLSVIMLRVIMLNAAAPANLANTCECGFKAGELFQQSLVADITR